MTTDHQIHLSANVLNINNSNELKHNLWNQENEETNEIKYGFKSACSQITASIGQTFILMTLGLIFVMPTIVIGEFDHKTASNATRLTSPQMILTDEQSSWLGSMLLLFHPLGAVISGAFMEVIGRKRLMMIVNIPFFVGFILIYLANTYMMLILGTVSLSLGIGCCEAPIISYIGEICEPRTRGALSSFGGSGVNFGLLVGFIIYALTDWRTTMLISSIFPVATLFMLMFLPESPTWLASKGRLKQAEKSLRWLRGWTSKDKVIVEFNQLVANTNDATVYVQTVPTSKNNMSTSRKPTEWEKFIQSVQYFRRPEIIRPFNMIFVIFFISLTASFQQFRPFLVDIFNTFGLPMSPQWILVLTGVLSISGSIVSMFTVNRFGKRPIALWSSGINIIFGILFGICALNLQWPGWIPLVVLCICVWVTGYGLLPLPWMLLSEVYPLQVRGLAAGISSATCYIILFVLTKTYIYCVRWFGLHGTIFISMFVGFIGFIYIYFFVPETEDKSLEQIMEYFTRDKPNVKKFGSQNKTVTKR